MDADLFDLELDQVLAGGAGATSPELEVARWLRQAVAVQPPPASFAATAFRARATAPAPARWRGLLPRVALPVLLIVAMVATPLWVAARRHERADNFSLANAALDRAEETVTLVAAAPRGSAERAKLLTELQARLAAAAAAVGRLTESDRPQAVGRLVGLGARAAALAVEAPAPTTATSPTSITTAPAVPQPSPAGPTTRGPAPTTAPATVATTRPAPSTTRPSSSSSPASTTSTTDDRRGRNTPFTFPSPSPNSAGQSGSRRSPTPSPSPSPTGYYGG